MIAPIAVWISCAIDHTLYEDRSTNRRQDGSEYSRDGDIYTLSIAVHNDVYTASLAARPAMLRLLPLGASSAEQRLESRFRQLVALGDRIAENEILMHANSGGLI
jgi:hypothetical protein